MPEFLTKAALKRRGWHKKQIEDLGEPDKREPNPHYPDHPLCLFSMDRVIAREQTERWQRAQKLGDKLSAIMKEKHRARRS